MENTFQQQFAKSPVGNITSTRPRKGSVGSLGSGSASKTFHGHTGISVAGSPACKKSTAQSSSRFSVSGRTNKSISGIRSEYNIVEKYGTQLPVVVSEVLIFNKRIEDVSVKCSPNGWSWLVHGRNLIIWQYKDTRAQTSSPTTNRWNGKRRRGPAMAQYRELTLPHCDIGHKASLVSVFVVEGQPMASCIAVSPTGDARYWPSIVHTGTSIDLTGMLDGQEFDCLLETSNHENYVLVTTTCTLVYLRLHTVNGRTVLHHKTLRQPIGLLSSIGKKFASIIIGINSSNEKESKYISAACENSTEGDVMITLLSDRYIQRWRIFKNSNSEQMLYEDTEIVLKIRDEFQQKFWNVRLETSEIEVHCLDMRICGGKTYILAGAVNAAHMPQMYYAIAILTGELDAMRLVNFVPLKLTQFYSVTTEAECLSLRFIVGRSHLYIYTKKVVYPVSLLNMQMSEMEAEKIEFHMQDDCVLTAAVINNLPLFFSRDHGVVCVTPGDFDATEIIHMSTTSTDLYAPSVTETIIREQNMLSAMEGDGILHMFELDPDAIYNEFKDEVSQLKAAFVYHLKRKQIMCKKILNDLLRCTVEGHANGLVDVNLLDKIVIQIAEDLAEDIPAADPRWESEWDVANGNKHALGSSSSMQILTQLREKSVALRHFIEFLHSTGIWNQLSVGTCCGGIVTKASCYAIADISEKIVAAITLRNLQSKYSHIIDQAITGVVSHWEKNTENNLTAQDLFYVHLCKFQEIFKSLTDITTERIESHKQARSLASFICDINTIVLGMLNEVIASREQHSAMFALPAEKLDSYEYLPWTAISGHTGIRDSLSLLVDISMRNGTSGVADVELRQKLYQQVLELIDFILHGRKNYLDSVHDTEKYKVLQQQYESQRRDFISVFLNDNQYELATKLAEKYLDFQSLVIICDETNNQERLDEYIKRYEEYNFSQVAISWHLRQNRQGEIFERFKGNQAALSQFMRDHPTLGWIQLVFNGDFERAAKILFQLAQTETEYLKRKKCMLSLAKLATFTAADVNLQMQLDIINSELLIIDYQEKLSEELLESFGYDVEKQRVLKVDEIINLYIAEENEKATEFDFRKAVELLQYLDDPYEARHKIWCAAILRDNWVKYDADTAVDYLQNLIFFKFIEICHLLDGDFDSFLPPIQDFLTSTELGDLIHNKSFQYLLKLTYEYINDSYKKTDEVMEE